MNDNKRYTFSNTLRGVLQEESFEFAMQIGSTLEKYLDTWKKAPPPVSTMQTAARARQLHMITDTVIADDLERDKPPVSCRVGCAHCCKMAVGITGAEADLLVSFADYAGKTLPIGTLERQALYGDDDTWAAQSEVSRTCVFLNHDQTCSVYGIRPMACRKYYVISPADQCNITKYPGGDTYSWFSLDAEIIATAAMTHWSTGPMPNMLLEALARKDQEQHKESITQ